ncbi:hypothetical protein KLEP7_gp96 [Pseudaeromonas phage vB_PpeM_ KLEP7]|nr:hypothetical protein KLEP7_gp96 [Pseudaeromonas phage vB_PpeM_ KLEP7]
MLWFYLVVGLVYGIYYWKIESKNKVKKYHVLLAWLLCLPYIIILAFWVFGWSLFEKLNEPA